MPDCLALDKSEYAPGEPITASYDFSDALQAGLDAQLGVLQESGTRAMFEPVTASGPQVRTFEFDQSDFLPPSKYWIAGIFRKNGVPVPDPTYAETFAVAATSAWTPIGSDFAAVFTGGGDGCYGLTTDGRLASYNGTPNDWTTATEGIGRALGAGTFGLFASSRSSGETRRLDAWDQWSDFGPPMDLLLVGDAAVYGVTGGNLWSLSSPTMHTEIGAVGNNAIAVNDRFVFVLAADGSVAQYLPGEDGSLGTWTPLPGGPWSEIHPANNALYSYRGSDKTVWRYDSGPDNAGWTSIGTGFTRCFAGGTSLVGRAADGNLWAFSGTPNQWQQVAGPADQVSFGDDVMFGLRNGEALVAPLPLSDPSAVVASAETTSEQLRRPLSAPPAAATSVWDWTFDTADKAFAGYDGTVWLMVYGPSKAHAGEKLPQKAFKRGQMYTFSFTWAFDELEAIRPVGSTNFFHEHWTVGKITAYSHASHKLYTWNSYGDIPDDDDESSSRAPDSVVVVPPPPNTGTTVCVWAYRGRDAAWGHASLMLSDGTYISWWPVGQNHDSIPYVTDIFTAAAIDPRTYHDDIWQEDQSPDVALRVTGLDEPAIKTWWGAFKTSHKWKTLTQNCSTTVRDALYAGGASSLLSPRDDADFDTVTVWTPSDIEALARAIGGGDVPPPPS